MLINNLHINDYHSIIYMSSLSCMFSCSYWDAVKMFGKIGRFVWGIW